MFPFDDVIMMKVPKWGRISYEIKYTREHQIWYEMATYSLGDMYAKFKSITLSAYQDIHILTQVYRGYVQFISIRLHRKLRSGISHHLWFGQIKCVYFESSTQQNLLNENIPLWVSLTVPLLGFTNIHHVLNCLLQSWLYLQLFYSKWANKLALLTLYF